MYQAFYKFLERGPFQYILWQSQRQVPLLQVTQDGRIVFGTTVHLLDLETEEEFNYQIVGDDEADIKLGKISVNAPVARSLIGKLVGDIVEVKVPSGLKEYEVMAVTVC